MGFAEVVSFSKEWQHVEERMNVKSLKVRCAPFSFRRLSETGTAGSLKEVRLSYKSYAILKG
jgi:hypothetical protein